MDKTTTSRATLIIMLVFFLQPLALGGWLALIPLVKADLGLSNGQLAMALVGLPIALIPCLQIAGSVVSRFGPRRMFKLFFPAQGLAILLPLLAWNVPSLFFALFAVGAAMAFLEVSMNVYAGRLEKQADVLIMNRCHGFWALGLMTGSAIVTVLSGVNPIVAVGALILLSTGPGVWSGYAAPWLEGEEAESSPPRRKFSALPPVLIAVGIFMFVVTLTEGAMADWAAVYLAERLDDPNTRAGIAVTIFSAFMAGGRFLGDILKRRFGAVRQARLTTSCALVGLLLLVLPLPLWMAFPGFALVGFGVSSAYPLGVSAVAALDDRYEASNIAFVATMALGGFLVGPPLIGGLSELFSLPVGLAALIPGLFLALYLTRWLRPESVK